MVSLCMAIFPKQNIFFNLDLLRRLFDSRDTSPVTPGIVFIWYPFYDEKKKSEAFLWNDFSAV